MGSEELFDYVYNWHYDEWEWWYGGKLLYTADGDRVEMRMNRDSELSTKLEAFKVMCAEVLFYKVIISDKFPVMALIHLIFNS